MLLNHLSLLSYRTHSSLLFHFSGSSDIQWDRKGVSKFLFNLLFKVFWNNFHFYLLGLGSQKNIEIILCFKNNLFLEFLLKYNCMFLKSKESKTKKKCKIKFLWNKSFFYVFFFYYQETEDNTKRNLIKQKKKFEILN